MACPFVSVRAGPERSNVTLSPSASVQDGLREGLRWLSTSSRAEVYTARLRITLSGRRRRPEPKPRTSVRGSPYAPWRSPSATSAPSAVTLRDAVQNGTKSYRFFNPSTLVIASLVQARTAGGTRSRAGLPPCPVSHHQGLPGVPQRSQKATSSTGARRVGP